MNARTSSLLDTMAPDVAARIRAVFERFAALTGIPTRLPTQTMCQQALLFADHFQLWELDVVIAWLKVMIHRAESGERSLGFSRLSLQWGNIFGKDGDVSGLGPFEQRLGLAIDWARKHRPSLIPQPAPEGNGTRTAKPKPVSEDERERIAAQARELFAKMQGAV